MKQKQIYQYGTVRIEAPRTSRELAGVVHFFILASLLIGLGWCGDLVSGYSPQDHGETPANTTARDESGAPDPITQATETIANQPTKISPALEEPVLKQSDSKSEAIADSKEESKPAGVDRSLSGDGSSDPSANNIDHLEVDLLQDGSATPSADGGKADERSEPVSPMESRALPPDPRKSGRTGVGRPITGDSLKSEQKADSSGSSFNFIGSSDWILKTLGALGAVIGLILLLRPVLKKFAGPLGSARAPSGVIEALARYPFGKGQSLVLLKLDRRVLFICQSGQGSNLITEITDPDDVASILRRVHDENGESFNRKLEDLLQGQDRGRATQQVNGESSGIVDLTGGGSRQNWLSRILGARHSGGRGRNGVVTEIMVDA